ncbi:DUF4249 domain-containing protein [Pedobacter sp.]|uniref:DUF4249 domain-containing protein n=1 Tax=Pedobacter sp. TaxID=1411316 RepID=UPI003BA9A8F5
MKRLILYFALLLLSLGGCKKIIDIDTKDAPPQIVIEGKIIDSLIDQQIKISKTVGYSELSIYPKVSGAVVTVTDNKGNKFEFKETAPGIYTNRMKGVPGTTYSMSVTAEGSVYTANSMMPKKVLMDSIGVINNYFFGSNRKTTAAYLTDPKNEPNQYRFYLYRNGVLSKSIYANNDRLTDGNDLRVQLFFFTDEERDEELNTGDQLVVELECVDAQVFDYWFSLAEQVGRGPNQGTTPANPPSNISNNALGYFSANTYQKLGATVK